MIVAGIDEAGYGPLLGPLVVGCCAFEVDAPERDAGKDQLPCLWKRLRRIASRCRDKKRARLHVNDSKLVYSPAMGLGELERSVLAFAAVHGGACERLHALLERLAGMEITAEMGQYAWYAPLGDEKFPLEHDAVGIRIMANALNVEMQRSGVRCVHMAARIVLERRLNAMLEQTRNKSNALFSIAAIHLDHLLRNFGERQLVIYCDQQGGREHYGHLLRLMFDEWALEVLEEADGHAEYRMLRGGYAVRLIFRERAEKHCLAVALASMISKYSRETLMRRFNAYWRGLVPDLEPTAGYYNDGLRFLSDIAAKKQELGIADGQLVRMR